MNHRLSQITIALYAADKMCFTKLQKYECPKTNVQIKNILMLLRLKGFFNILWFFKNIFHKDTCLLERT